MSAPRWCRLRTTTGLTLPSCVEEGRHAYETRAVKVVALIAAVSCASREMRSSKSSLIFSTQHKFCWWFASARAVEQWVFTILYTVTSIAVDYIFQTKRIAAFRTSPLLGESRKEPLQPGKPRFLQCIPSACLGRPMKRGRRFYRETGPEIIFYHHYD